MLDTPTPTPAGLSRRQLVKAGTWATPALVLATALPAAAASTTSGPTSGFSNIGDMVAQGMIQPGQVSDHSGVGHGPIYLEASQIQNWSSETKTFSYEVKLDTPDGWVTIFPAKTLTIAPSSTGVGPQMIPHFSYGDERLPAGTYDVTIFVTGHDGTFTIQGNSVTLAP